MLVVAPETGVKNSPVSVPPIPVFLVHVPPVCSKVMNKFRSIGAELLSQIVVVPSTPAFGAASIFTVTILKSAHGETPPNLYSKVLTAEAPTPGSRPLYRRRRPLRTALRSDFVCVCMIIMCIVVMCIVIMYYPLRTPARSET